MRPIDADKLKEELSFLRIVRISPELSKAIFMTIDNAPTITPDMAQVLAYESGKANAERPSGNWELCEDSDGKYGICSNCGKDIDFSYYGKAYDYCPNCGARMEAENEQM